MVFIGKIGFEGEFVFKLRGSIDLGAGDLGFVFYAVFSEFR